MEVRKVNTFFPVFIVAYIGLSVIASAVMAALNNAGVMVPDWIQYVLSEGIILVIAIVYMAVNRIDPLRIFHIKDRTCRCNIIISSRILYDSYGIVFKQCYNAVFY